MNNKERYQEVSTTIIVFSSSAGLVLPLQYSGISRGYTCTIISRECARLVLKFKLDPSRQPIWPRTISKYSSDEREILVFNKEEAHAQFKQSSFLDCRISTYPDYTVLRDVNASTTSEPVHRVPPEKIVSLVPRTSYTLVT